MSTLTPNYNLKKPDSTDPFGDFRQDYNDNMDIIDANLGGGGGSGGHTIIDENDTPMTQRTGLQFTGNVSVSDDAVNDKTVVDIKGGAVFGFAIDENRKLFEGTMTNFTQTLEYTATEDAIALMDYYGSNGTNQWIVLNGVSIPFAVLSSGRESFALPIRKGDTIAGRHTSDNENCYFHLACYGIKQGTNGIFAPVIYSDTERVIGIWRDNKPLYQKTFVKNSTDASGTGVSFDVSALDIDYCVDIYGTCDRIVTGVGTLIYPFNAYEDSSLRTYVAYSKFNNCINFNIRFYLGESTSTQYITILYTKNSDVAGSGNWNTDGVPTVHYSTSEQVVGTWYNGKPIYEKVLTPSVNVGSNTIAHGIANFEECVSIRGMCKYNGTSEHLPLPYVSTNIAYVIALGNVSTTTFLIDVASGFSSIENCKVIIQYTKTTD